MTRTDVNVAAAVVPADRVRWGAIIAGLFAALSTLAVLGVLGAAVGFSAYDRGDDLGRFGLGAGIWGAISALVAFLIGGWLAAKTAAHRGEGNGVLNGSMVWVAAVPLLLYVLSGGIGAILRPATDAAARAGQTALTDERARQEAIDRAQQAGARITEGVTGQDIDRGRDNAARASWITLASLLLGLGASALGGYLGSGRDRARRDFGDAGYAGTSAVR